MTSCRLVSVYSEPKGLKGSATGRKHVRDGDCFATTCLEARKSSSLTDNHMAKFAFCRESTAVCRHVVLKPRTSDIIFEVNLNLANLSLAS